MTPLDSQTEATLRQFFRYFNKIMLLLWRLGIGPSMSRYPNTTGRFMVIVHTGRKTGLRRLTPVNYAEIEGGLYCTTGFGSVSHWYQNILANPQVEIWLENERWAATAEDVSDHPDRLKLLREVLKGSGFVAPMIGVDPHTLSDEKLNQATVNYRLIHLRRTEPRTGPGSPGDLAWVWPAGFAFLLPLALAGLFGRGRKRK
ncbi:MAG: nitroreductase family deazaflavin-dependent oxidoreductase [Chloroflexi bacterium]|nr:nitroreductase family deazaflavin-dependent oxidoreductase [Chloroflexota bacterium]